MSPIQQMLLGVGGVADPVYVDDVFSTYVYKGTSGSLTLNTGLNMSGDGGLSWIKNRTGDSTQHLLIDTVRGANKAIKSDTTGGEVTLAMNQVFTSTGFTLNSSGDDWNSSSYDYTTWNFRKAPGFFDVVSYTGTGSAHSISHSLGSVPGCLIIKNLGAGYNWQVFHIRMDSENPANYAMQLDQKGDRGSSSTLFNDTLPTSTQFTVGTNGDVNTNGENYICYLFAGGASTSTLAKSVNFDGTGDELSIADSEDFNYGSGDFTLECWVNPNSVFSDRFLHAHTNSTANEGPCQLYFGANNLLQLYSSSTGSGFDVAAGKDFGVCTPGVWSHVAVAREGNNIRLFFNGINVQTISYSGSLMNPTGTFDIGGRRGSDCADARVSNFRVVKGTAVYTSSFNPPTEPLTNITNTKLLCCNNSSTTGSTVTPGTITANGDPTASVDSPFEDTSSFVFGENKDESIIKCGKFVVTDSGFSAFDTVNIGWEPQWILEKASNQANTNWSLYDNIRGADYYKSAQLYAQSSSEEGGNDDQPMFIPTSTGFKVRSNNADTRIFIAIRRPDAYVGKPASAGTDVFAMDTGSGSSDIPTFDSSFPVDFAFRRAPALSDDWTTCSRLTGVNRVYTNKNSAQGPDTGCVFDSNVGWATGQNSAAQSWMWKRGKGHDVVPFTGTGSARTIKHSMSIVPEFIIFKNMVTASNQWYIYHKGLNGGSSPEDYYIKLGASGDAAEAGDSGGNLFNSTAPTARTFSVGTSSAINESNALSFAILFASVEGISQCGFYDGSNSDVTITFDNGGFSPRYVLIKRVDDSGDWVTLDTTRGWGTTGPVNDCTLYFNKDNTQYCSTYDWGSPTSTGMRLGGGSGYTNTSGGKYIYYAHA